MREINVRNAIIFCNRKKDVGIVHRSLLRHGFNVGALHGDMDQHQRTATLDAFRNGTGANISVYHATRGLLYVQYVNLNGFGQALDVCAARWRRQMQTPAPSR